MITVLRPAPLLTVQDRGRFGFLADGITRSGPLDALALEVGNSLVGNGRDAATLEGCLGGATIRFERATEFALTGAELEATLDGATAATFVSHGAAAGSVLHIERIVRGAIWYLAVAEGIRTPLVLASRATLLSAGIGTVVRKGDTLDLGDGAAQRPSPRSVPSTLRTPLDDAPVPLCDGPRADALSGREWRAFEESVFTVSHTISRVGYRLEGPLVPSRIPADIASEAACAGAMQLPPEGQPIVLMADHPTVGGYPVIGVVPAYARGALAQRPPGAHVRFARVSIPEAISAWKSQRSALSEWDTGE